MARKGSSRGGLPGFFERMGLRCLANMSGSGGGGSAEESADPAPIFLVQPRVAPSSGVANQDLFTGTPGTVSYGAITATRWLLNGDQIGTGLTIISSAPGTLVFEVTANGPGGSTTATSASIIVSAAPTPTPTPTPAPAFTVAPSISPASGTAGSTTFTADDGTISGGSFASRRWLLSGVSIGTLSTVDPLTAGELVLEVTATGPGGTTVTTSSSVTVAPAPSPTPTPSPTIPTVLPGAGWAGTASPTPSGTSLQNWTPYGTVDDSIWPNAQFTFADMGVIEGETIIRAIAETTAQDGVDKVYASFEDGAEVEVPWAAHPTTGKFDYLFKMGDGTGRNGIGLLRVRVVPKNGLERIHWKTVVKNDNPGGAGYITRVHRYVDPSKADDSGDGLSWATAKKTTYAAINSFTAGDCSTKICRVNLKEGTVPWFEQNGRSGGISATFKYRPEFFGQGRKDEATETKLSFRDLVTSPSDATPKYQFRWYGLGPRPYFSNMLIDWAKIIVQYTGAVYEDFDEISDLGHSQAIDPNGFPYGVHTSEIGNAPIQNSNLWREGRVSTGYAPGETGRWGGERHTKANYTSTFFAPCSVQERWDGQEIYTQDAVFISTEGDWLIDNVEQSQGIQTEQRLHIEQDIVVVSVSAPNTPSAGQRTITFTGTFTAALINDTGNLFIRVTESAAGVDAGDIEYPAQANGIPLLSTLGYLVDATTTTNRNLPISSNQIVVTDSGNRFALLAAGDKMRAYARLHGDTGQTNYDAAASNTWANRENITLRFRKTVSEQSQPYLVQIGSLSSATATSISTVPAAIAGYTVSTSGRIATFSPGIPPALPMHSWIEPKNDPLCTKEARRVVRVLNATQVYLDAPFAKDADESAYDLPAGTSFAGYRGIHGFIESGSLLHKAGYLSVFHQFQTGLSGSGFLHCSYPGWTTSGPGSITIRPPVAGWRRGGFDIRYINSILFRVTSDYNLLPKDLKFINCHVEYALPGTNAVISNTDTGIVFGHPVFTAAAAQGYVPSAGMTRTVATVYAKRRLTGEAIEIGSRIGAY